MAFEEANIESDGILMARSTHTGWSTVTHGTTSDCSRESRTIDCGVDIFLIAFGLVELVHFRKFSRRIRAHISHNSTMTSSKHQLVKQRRLIRT
jgi:hypothetical protein